MIKMPKRNRNEDDDAASSSGTFDDAAEQPASDEQPALPAAVAECADILRSIFEGDPNGPALSTTENDVEDEKLKNCLDYLKAHYTRPLQGHSAALDAAVRFDVRDKYLSGTLLPSGSDGLEMLYRKKELALVRLKFQFVRRGIVDLDTTESLADAGDMAVKADFIRVHECMRRMYDALMSDLLARKSLDPSWASECPTNVDPFGLTPFDVMKLNDYQTFLIFVLNHVKRNGYRRYRGAAYREITSPMQADGRHYRSHAWERVCDIKDLVVRCAPKELHFVQWQYMTCANNQSKAIDYLTNNYDVDFPDLKPDRHWHAFHNGLYFTRKGAFYAFGTPEARHVPPDAVACKYHNMDFDQTIIQQEWHEVATPSVQQILQFQLQDLHPDDLTEVIAWIYALLGRLLFEVNEMDSWQVIPFFIGRAGTGKSLLAKAVGWFFPDEDVETMANNVQDGFGLETFVDKLMWRCFEVKSDFRLEQAQLQSMITGEEMSIMRKNKPAVTSIWRVPGILAGNELANWSDNSGSISRRMILVYFKRKVENSNPHLDKDIQRELGNLLHKCCMAYLMAVQVWGKSDLWGSVLTEGGEVVNVLPAYFHKQRNTVKEQTHQLESFLNNEGKIVVTGNAEDGMPFKAFTSLADAYFAMRSIPKFRWDKTDKYETVLEDHGVRRARITREYCKTHGLDYGKLLGGDADTDWIWGAKQRGEHIEDEL